MHVTHFESRAIARQSARAERRQTTFMGQLRQRIGLIHELRKLRTPEEIADDRAQRLRVDQLLRRHPIDVDVEQRHALFDQTLGARETDAALVGEQFTDRAHATAPEMIDVVERALAAAEIDQILDRGDEIFVRQNALAKIDVDPKFLVDLVTDNPAEIIFFWIEKESLEQSAGIGNRRWITWPEAPVNILERFLLIMRSIFPERLYHRVVMRAIDNVNFANLETHNLADRCQSERLERARDCDC